MISTLTATLTALVAGLLAGMATWAWITRRRERLHARPEIRQLERTIDRLQLAALDQRHDDQRLATANDEIHRLERMLALALKRLARAEKHARRLGEPLVDASAAPLDHPDTPQPPDVPPNVTPDVTPGVAGKKRKRRLAAANRSRRVSRNT